MIVQSKEEGCSEKQQENAIKGRSRFYLPIFLQRPNKPFEILSTRIREKIIIFKFPTEFNENSDSKTEEY